MEPAHDLLQQDSVDSCLFPDGIVRTLTEALSGARLLNVQREGAPSSGELFDMFHPTRLVEGDLARSARAQRFSLAELPGAFDGAFLLGLLPAFVDPDSDLFDEVTRVLAPGGLLIASTPLRARVEAPIPGWALDRTRGPFDLIFELTRDRFDLLKAHVGATRAGRFVVVARKR